MEVIEIVIFHWIQYGWLTKTDSALKPNKSYKSVVAYIVKPTMVNVKLPYMKTAQSYVQSSLLN